MREVEPRLADQFESMMRVTVAPTMIRASEKENVIPSRCTVRVDCRVPPGMGEQHVRRRVEELLGPEGEGGYTLEFSEDVVGNSSPPESDLAEHLREFVRPRGSRRGAFTAGFDGFYGQPLVSEGVSGVRRIRLLSAARDVALGHAHR